MNTDKRIDLNELDPRFVLWVVSPTSPEEASAMREACRDTQLRYPNEHLSDRLWGAGYQTASGGLEQDPDAAERCASALRGGSSRGEGQR
jgi:hypothetical protein